MKEDALSSERIADVKHWATIAREHPQQYGDTERAETILAALDRLGGLEAVVVAARGVAMRDESVTLLVGALAALDETLR